jgi:hypothetical protein
MYRDKKPLNFNAMVIKENKFIQQHLQLTSFSSRIDNFFMSLNGMYTARHILEIENASSETLNLQKFS